MQVNEPGTWSDGGTTPRNTGDQPLVIEAFGLVDPEGGARALDAVVYPIGEDGVTLVGTMPWAQAEVPDTAAPARGATIPPGESVALVLKTHLQPEASYAGTWVKYSSAGADYRVENEHEVLARTRCS